MRSSFPGATARTGVPSGAGKSTPLWKIPASGWFGKKRGPKGDEMQEPAGNTSAWMVAVAGVDRNRADAGSEVNTTANAIATPRTISPPVRWWEEE